jgi:hypothetical protein
MWSVPAPLILSDENRATLTAWINARNSPQKIVLRAWIILLAAEGKSNRGIAQELGTTRPTVILWRERFASAGCSRTGPKHSSCHATSSSSRSLPM